MKLFRNHAAFFALVGALLLPVLLSGCGGSGSTVASRPATQHFTAAIPFASRQTGTLNLSLFTQAITGTLSVPAVPAPAARRAPQAVASSFSFTVPSGTYTIDGAAAASGEFTVHGQFPDPIGRFTLTGTLPTQTTPGSFTLTINGETITGEIPPFGSVTPTTPTPMPMPTPTPTPTPTPGPIANALGLTFSGVSGASADTSQFQTTTLNGNFLKLTPNYQMTAFYEMPGNSGVTRQIIFEGPTTSGPVTAGTVFTYTAAQGEGEGVQTLFYVEKNAAGVETASWASVGGQLRIDAVQADGIRFTLIGVRMQPSPNPKGATGTFTLDGSGALRDPSAP